MAALAILKGSTLSRNARLHFCFDVSRTMAAVGFLTVWKSGITPKIRPAVGGVATGAGAIGITGIAASGGSAEGPVSAESPQTIDCAPQTDTSENPNISVL